MRPGEITNTIAQAARRAVFAVLTAALCVIATPAAPVFAQSPPVPPGGGFSNPAACRLGIDCWILNYPDMAPGPKVRDPYCKHRTFDTHKGTDIAIRDVTTMRRGVDVVAAANGTVRRTRDTVADQVIWTEDLRAQTKGKECGNGVVIDHGAGWEAQYCHLGRGSIIVKPGDRVVRGQTIGRIGASGLTGFPHVHLSLRWNGKIVDPLTGRFGSNGCGEPVRSLWSDAGLARYGHTQLYAVGLTDRAVTSRQVKENAGTAISLPPNAPALVLWAAVFGVAKGDSLRSEISGPDGRILRRSVNEIKRPQAWRMMYSGFRRRGDKWAPGTYRGRVTLVRSAAGGATEQTRTVTIDIRR